MKSVKLLASVGAMKYEGHGMSKISHTEPSQHCIITYLTHMEEMECFSSGLLGVLAANNLGFGLALAEIRQTFGQQQC